MSCLQRCFWDTGSRPSGSRVGRKAHILGKEGQMTDQNVALMAHLLRRAGFGASREEIEAKAAQGYDATVEELLSPAAQPPIEEDLMMRYHPAYNHSAAIETNVQQWVYRMINNPR